MPRRGHSETRKIRILSTPGERIAIQQLIYKITLKKYIVKGSLTKRPPYFNNIYSGTGIGS